MAKDLVDSLYGATFEATGLTALEAFVVSFCTHADDHHYEQENGLLSQWRGYSGQDGFCLVFDTAALRNLLGREFDSRSWVHLQMDAVRYAVDGTTLDTHFPSLVGAAAQSLAQFLNGTGLPPLSVEAVSEFLRAATLLKHQGFREEREVRIVAIPGTAARIEQQDFRVPLPDIRYRPQNDRRYIPLFDGLNLQLPIERVIVGPSRNQAANVARARELLGSSIPVTCSATPWLPPPPSAG